MAPKRLIISSQGETSSPYFLIERYIDLCTELKLLPNPYIVDVLEQIFQLSPQKAYAGFRLYLAGNYRYFPVKRLTDSDAVALVCTLCKVSFITGLDLRYNRLTNCGAEHIAKLLLQNHTLKYLRMNGNKFGNKGGMYFATMLQINCTLEDLDLGDCDLGTESLIALTTVLNKNRNLKSLNVSRPLLHSLQEKVTAHVALMLSINQTLQELHLGKQGLNNFDVDQLCEALLRNQTLRYLDLRCNQISRDGARSLAELLKHDTPLQILDLTANRIEDEGLVYISESLLYLNHNLKALAVVSNSITGIGLVAFANALKANRSLTHFYFWGNEMDETACKVFANLIKVGRLKPNRTDVQPYWINGRVYLAEVSHGLRKHYYWTPISGEDEEPAANAGPALLKAAPAALPNGQQM
eukprot:gi/632987588/ref/XP_007882638.1/ PREDICTED: leucine-rich repeat-containing protein 34 [Callorhinchus milii]